MIDLGREVAANRDASVAREWLVTNGLGSYASGTVAQLQTRRYHGLLVAALAPPLGRTVLLSKLDETARYNEHEYPLFTNRWGRADAAPEPPGYVHIERFRLEGTVPVWTFALGDALLEKRVLMEQEEDTTYVLYEHTRGSAPIQLVIKALVNYRDFHANTRASDWQMHIGLLDSGVQVSAFEGAVPFVVLCPGAHVSEQHTWYRDHFLDLEGYRGLDALGDDLYAARFEFTLEPGASATVVASTTMTPATDGRAAFDRQHAHETRLLAGHSALPRWQQQLILSADHFVVGREPGGKSVIAGYHWFGDWGRDTMISLPGLTLATARPDVAARILRTFARHVDQGMLPNRFPDSGETPEYNTVDATLWYFEALRAYSAATGDMDLIRELYPTLVDIIDHHHAGTRHGILVDPVDGLLSAGEAGVQLTWMDAKVGDRVVTPRIGKPVEVNALWYQALKVTADFATMLGEPAVRFDRAAEKARAGFQRFWNEPAGYCFDVIDGPDGNDAALRPNQLFAVSLLHSPLTTDQRRAVVDVCSRHLLTPLGLRTLSPDDPAYAGRYGGGPVERDGAYHQGTAWPWLLGTFALAHFRTYGNRDAALEFLSPLVAHLLDHGLGSVSEIADGDPPHTPRGAIAQAWSVAEALNVWDQLRSDTPSSSEDNVGRGEHRGLG